jgi:hypothetical protein
LAKYPVGLSMRDTASCTAGKLHRLAQATPIVFPISIDRLLAISSRGGVIRNTVRRRAQRE